MGEREADVHKRARSEESAAARAAEQPAARKREREDDPEAGGRGGPPKREWQHAAGSEEEWAREVRRAVGQTAEAVRQMQAAAQSAASAQLMAGAAAVEEEGEVVRLSAALKTLKREMEEAERRSGDANGYAIAAVTATQREERGGAVRVYLAERERTARRYWDQHAAQHTTILAWRRAHWAQYLGQSYERLERQWADGKEAAEAEVKRRVERPRQLDKGECLRAARTAKNAAWKRAYGLYLEARSRIKDADTASTTTAHDYHSERVAEAVDRHELAVAAYRRDWMAAEEEERRWQAHGWSAGGGEARRRNEESYKRWEQQERWRQGAQAAGGAWKRRRSQPPPPPPQAAAPQRQHTGELSAVARLKAAAEQPEGESRSKVVGRLRNLLRYVYTHHPPPGGGAAPTDETLRDDGKLSKFSKRAAFAYSPDKRGAETAEEKEIYDEAQKLLNNAYGEAFRPRADPDDKWERTGTRFG